MSVLTEREIKVLKLLAEGMDTVEVGRQFFFPERTAKNILDNVTTRLNLRNRTNAVAYATRQGFKTNGRRARGAGLVSESESRGGRNQLPPKGHGGALGGRPGARVVNSGAVEQPPPEGHAARRSGRGRMRSSSHCGQLRPAHRGP
jgi:DNA-binding CsgD family transcriptional regulator